MMEMTAFDLMVGQHYLQHDLAGIREDRIAALGDQLQIAEHPRAPVPNVPGHCAEIRGHRAGPTRLPADHQTRRGDWALPCRRCTGAPMMIRRPVDGCRGFLHADGYGGFQSLYVSDPKTNVPHLIEVACWSHARRKIYDLWCPVSYGIAAQPPSDRKASISLTNFVQAGSSASSAWFSLSSATNLAFGIEAARRRPSSNGTSLSRIQ
jgi:Transposase IS66 family